MHSITKAMIEILDLFVRAHDSGDRLHGWRIARETGRSGPTVYGVLDRLEDAEWIIGEFEEIPPGVNRPRRRYYHFTDRGLENARTLLTLQGELS